MSGRGMRLRGQGAAQPHSPLRCDAPERGQVLQHGAGGGGGGAAGRPSRAPARRPPAAQQHCCQEGEGGDGVLSRLRRTGPTKGVSNKLILNSLAGFQRDDGLPPGTQTFPG